MLRFTTLAIVLLCSISSVQSQYCQGLLEEYSNCIVNAPGTGVDSSVDDVLNDAACTECYTNNILFEENDPTSCDDATTELCTFFDMCLHECFPTNTICSEEVIAYYTCSFATTYAPESCTVTCDDSNVGEGGDKDAEVQKDSTSAGSTTSALIALSVSASALLFVAGSIL